MHIDFFYLKLEFGFKNNTFRYFISQSNTNEANLKYFYMFKNSEELQKIGVILQE